MSIKVLQLSDLHFGKNFANPDDLICSIETALDGEDVDLIIFTGDLIDGKMMGSDDYEKYIKMAIDFFDSLIAELNDNKEKTLTKNDILFIPGNHEINRNNNDRFDRYNIFLCKFYENNIPSYYNQDNWSVVKEFKEEKIVFAGFNSANYIKDNSNHVTKEEL